MKQIGFLRKVTYTTSSYLYTGCAAFFSALQALSAIDTDNPHGFLKMRPVWTRAVEVIQDTSFVLYIILAAIAAWCFCVRRMSDPWVLEKVKFILDNYRNKCFEQFKKDAEDHHRVTLFCCERSLLLWHKHWSATNSLFPWGAKPALSRKFWPCRSRWLIPILRSGDTSQETSALFYVCDDSDKVEGIAGLAWATKQPIVLADLPDLTNIKQETKKRRQELLAEYSTKTRCDISFVQSYVERKRALPRSIAAVPVMVKDHVWGVIVLDSRRPDGVSNESVGNYELTVAVIGQLLEKA